MFYQKKMSKKSWVIKGKNQKKIKIKWDFFWLFSNIVYLSSQLTLAWFDLIKIASFLLQTLGKLNCWRWKDNCSKEICHFDFTWQHLLTKISVIYQFLKRNYFLISYSFYDKKIRQNRWHPLCLTTNKQTLTSLL